MCVGVGGPAEGPMLLSAPQRYEQVQLKQVDFVGPEPRYSEPQIDMPSPLSTGLTAKEGPAVTVSDR